jgi:hypothetical protein
MPPQLDKMAAVLTTANADTRTRVPFWLRAGLMLAVALCVFGWGTGYKLSLYQPTQTKAPHAKLCTRIAESDRGGVGASVQVHPPPQPANFTAQIALAFVQPTAAPAKFVQQQPPLPRHSLSHLFAAALFLRPPPAI